MKKNFNKKMYYFFIFSVTFSLIVIGATFAYFTASVTNNNVVKGDSATVSFSLKVERVTTIDMAFGLVPMKNSASPNAAKKMCYDDHGNAGCQMYRITVDADSDTIMFLDGYIFISTRDERLETRMTSIFTTDNEQSFNTTFTNEDFLDTNFQENLYIKTGKRGTDEVLSPNRTDDYNCLVFKDEKIGGDIGRKKVFYVMIWVYDNNEAQDYLQGMQLAYNGTVTFVTAEGNEISATFD